VSVRFRKKILRICVRELTRPLSAHLWLEPGPGGAPCADSTRSTGAIDRRYRQKLTGGEVGRRHPSHGRSISDIGNTSQIFTRVAPFASAY